MPGQGGRGGAILLLLAMLGGGWLWLQAGRGDEARLSRWGGLGAAVEANIAEAGAQSGGLSGVAQMQGRGLSAAQRPQGNPLQAPNSVMTQGYGVGSHAPAEIWGGVDLAIDGDGDGSADPQGTQDHPVYATHDGVAKLTPNSWPGGNHIWLTNEAYRTGYAHLASFAVQDGQAVRRGEVIGYVGSTGQSSGPHLHYDTWVYEGGAWINVSPLEFGALDGAGR
jgi:murein DD-endopeptidase MepM/ murein hydrolase activator NlpD